MTQQAKEPKQILLHVNLYFRLTSLRTLTKLSPLSARALEAGIPVRKSTGCMVIYCGYLLCKVSGSDEIEMALLQVFFF